MARKAICRQCGDVNRLAEGWRVTQCICGKCGGQIRGTVPASDEQDLPPVTLATVPPGTPPLMPEKSPPPAEDAPGQLVMFPGEGVPCE
jgi:hypothetical protein